ncbi:MAG: aspartate aminotransferase family protein, partial [Bacteroidota bacterium]
MTAVATYQREQLLNCSKDQFQRIGATLLQRIAEFNDKIETHPLTTERSTLEINTYLNAFDLPENGKDMEQLMAQTTELLFHQSLFNGHPGFMGYITSSPNPIGALADLLAATINPNMAASGLSPVATQMERQVIQWLAALIGYDTKTGGILVSGGNMANFTAFLAARSAKAPLDLKQKGLAGLKKQMTIYCSEATHTWIEKAAILFGHGLEAVRWIPTTKHHQMDTDALETTILEDLKAGHQPFIVIGTAGDVSTGMVDDLKAIAQVCQNYDLWFHVDGAYGAPAAMLPELKATFSGLAQADSIALDPHKWLYCPLEVGCTLVKNPQHLLTAYSSHPEYYNFDLNENKGSLNYYEFGLQNSRGFRALKVWLALQQIGKSGYRTLIREDIALSKYLSRLVKSHAELEFFTQHLSITTFRYVPEHLNLVGEERENYLNQLNQKLLNVIQQSRKVYVSNAVVDNQYCLRACIV